MRVFGKKYLLSLGVAFYPEKEMLRLEQEAAKGWRFMGMNRLALLKFEPTSPQEKQYAVDFFTGESVDLPEYLALYQASGWQLVSDFQKRYFYFTAEPNTPRIFSDAESYRERIQQEWRYQMVCSLKILFFGLFLGLGTFLLQKFGPVIPEGLSYFIFFLAGLCLIWPIAMLFAIFFMQKRYQDRADHFAQPGKFAKGQKIFQDTLLLMLAGGIFGGLLGYYFSSWFNF